MIAEVKIDKVGAKGQGVGFDTDGNIYFVEGAIPGDLVRVEFKDGARRYRDATLTAVVEPSASRRAPECEYFQKCGGCDWLHWDYPQQLQAKEMMLKHSLERNKMSPAVFAPMIPAEKLFNYRNRIQLRREGGRLGFLKKQSHDLVDVARCLVADEKLNAEMGKIREENATAPQQKIEIAVREDGSVSRWLDQPHGAGGFVQINPSQNNALRSLVASLVEKTGAKKVLELFCGDGNLTHAYLPHVDKVIAVDSNKSALDIAKAKADPKVEFHVAWVSPQLRSRFPKFVDEYDLLLLDPPRQGLVGLAQLLTPSVRDVLWVSCSMETFSKDAEPLKKDFTLVEAHPIDMFPHTRHIEFVTWWRRNAT